MSANGPKLMTRFDVEATVTRWDDPRLHAVGFEVKLEKCGADYVFAFNVAAYELVNNPELAHERVQKAIDVLIADYNHQNNVS